MRVANLTDNNIVADPGFGQRLHVSRSQWLPLLDAYERSWCLRPDPVARGLIHVIANNCPCHQTNNTADGRPGSRIMTRSITNQRTHASAGRATHQRAVGRAIRLAVGRITPAQQHAC